jgi:polysaccharide pyruvyl transferase WcaK-like protein
MNAHQQRLWERMITVIDEYKAKRTGFSTMVGELEGSLDAGEFRDQALVDEWYRHWTDLEVIRATAGDSAGYTDVSEAVETMQQFLRDKLVEKRAG